ncbi:MAG: hypothetical protein QOJ04_2869 [Caballeronia sp.]|jgi:hypothetical protein|nr:hypothetical protein [Caballeronia sp.]
MVPVDASQTMDPTPTSVALFNQGLLQVLQASAIVNAIGQIRRVVVPGTGTAADKPAVEKRRYLVIAPQVSGKPGGPLQMRAPRSVSFFSKQMVAADGVNAPAAFS